MVIAAMAAQSAIQQELKGALAEIERLTPYVDAFRREEERADKAEREIDDLKATAAAVDVIIRVAKGQSADPATDDLTVPLAIELAEKGAENVALRAAMQEIMGCATARQRTVHSFDLIAAIARAALAAAAG